MIPNRKALLPLALLAVLLSSSPAPAAEVYKGSLDPAIPHHAAILDTLSRLEQDPGNAALHNDLGCLVAWDGFWRDALRSFDKAAELAPKDSRPLFNGGLVQGLRGDWRGARSKFRKAVKLDPGNWPAWWMLGFSEEQLGNKGAAVDAYGRSLRVDTSLFDPKVNPYAVVSQLKAAALLATYEKRRVDAGLPFSNQIVEPSRVASFFQKGPKPGEAVVVAEEASKTGPVVTTVPPPGRTIAQPPAATVQPTTRRRRAYGGKNEPDRAEPTEVTPEPATAPAPETGEGGDAPDSGAAPAPDATAKDPGTAAPQPGPGVAPPRRIRTPGPGGFPEPKPE